MHAWDIACTPSAVKNVDVWPECWGLILFFREMATQWREGFGGKTGLDYTAVIARLNMLEISKEDRESIYQDVRHMEAEALEVMDEQRQRRST